MVLHGFNLSYDFAHYLTWKIGNLSGFIDGSMKENISDSGYSVFTEDIDGVPSRPIGTPFEGTSFAYRHRNVLFISVDAFRTVNNGKSNYMDRENGFGGEGLVSSFALHLEPTTFSM